MDFDPNQHTFVEYKKGSLQARIGELYDEFVKKMQGNIDRYASDDRRAQVNGRIDFLHGDGLRYFTPDGKSYFHARIANRKSAIDCIHALNKVGLITNPLSESDPLLTSLGALVEAEQHFGIHLDLTLRHDIFPQGHTDYAWTDGEVWGKADYDPTTWGHRHEVGFTFRLMTTDPETGLEQLRTTKQLLRARFDRDPAQLTTWDAVDPENRYAYPRSTDDATATRDAVDTDIYGLAAVAILAKDVRPVVENPDKMQSKLSTETALWEKIFPSTDSAAPAVNVPAHPRQSRGMETITSPAL